MKKNIIILCTLCIFLSCSYKRNRIENFQLLINTIERNPDYAFSLLDSLEKQGCVHSKEDALTYSLLKVSAKDIKDQPISNYFPTVLEAIHHFKYIKDKQKLKVAYYYAGRIEADENHAPEALNYFKKALETDAQNIELNNRICSQMGDLFYYQDLYVDAINMYKKAYLYATENKNYRKMSMALRDKALVYLEEKKANLALKSLKEAQSYTNRCNDYRLTKSIVGYLITTLCELKQYDKAKIYLNHFTQKVNRSDSSAIYSIAANAYSYINSDSAKKYYTFLLKNGNNYAKEKANLFFLKINLNENNPNQAKLYLNGYTQALDSIRMNTNSEMLAKVKGLYDYQQKEEEITKVKISNKKWQFIGFFAFCCLFFVSLLLLCYIQYIKLKSRNTRLQTLQLKRIQSETLAKNVEQLKANNEHIQELEKKLSFIKGEKTELRRKLKEECEKFKSINTLHNIEIKEKEVLLEEMKNSAIYKRIDSIIKSENMTHLTVNERKELIDTFDKIMPEYKQNLYSLYEMSTREILVCLLVRINIKPTCIATLLGCTTSAISQIRKRLYNKVFNKKGTAEDWDSFILSM